MKELIRNLQVDLKKHNAEILAWDPGITISFKNHSNINDVVLLMNLKGWEIDENSATNDCDIVHFVKKAKKLKVENEFFECKRPGQIIAAKLCGIIGLIILLLLSYTAYRDGKPIISTVLLPTFYFCVVIVGILILSFSSTHIDQKILTHRSIRTLFFQKSIPINFISSYQLKFVEYEDGTEAYFIFRKNDNKKLLTIRINRRNELITFFEKNTQLTRLEDVKGFFS